MGHSEKHRIELFYNKPLGPNNPWKKWRFWMVLIPGNYGLYPLEMRETWVPMDLWGWAIGSSCRCSQGEPGGRSAKIIWMWDIEKKLSQLVGGQITDNYTNIFLEAERVSRNRDWNFLGNSQIQASRNFVFFDIGFLDEASPNFRSSFFGSASSHQLLLGGLF